LVATGLPAETATHRRHRSSGVGGRAASVAIALATIGTAWLPWLKSPVTAMFALSAPRSSTPVRDAWDVPARFLWSYHAGDGGPTVAWLIVGVAAAVVVLGIVAHRWARVVERLLAVVLVLVPAMYMVQITRIVDDSPRLVGTTIGATDLVGFGTFVLLILAFALLVVPRR
jgi:hypothetical protein